jgi:hypothetical protein
VRVKLVMESRMEFMFALERCRGGAGAVTGMMRVEICVGDGVCASWCGVQIGFPSWGGQVEVFKSRYAGLDFLVSII